jgi:hypothetical protein
MAKQNTPSPEARDSDRLCAELERIGLLLLQDKALPCATTLLAGGPVHGSWWGHALGHYMFAVLERFEDGAGALSVKLINSKVTFVAARLWPTFITLALDQRNMREQTLNQGAQMLLQRASAGPLRVDHIDAAEFGSKAKLNTLVATLSEHLLAHVSSVHSESGKHVKVLRSWEHWAKEHKVRMPSGSDDAKLKQAREDLNSAVELLCAGMRRPKVALLDRRLTPLQ